MSYKDLLVHIDPGERSLARLDVALDVAQRFSARLTGLFGQSDPHVLIPASRDPAAALGSIAADSEALFRNKAAAANVPVEWATAMTVNDTELVKRLLFAARNADLTILGQHDPRAHDVSGPPDLVEQIVLNSGRPVLVVPYAGHFATVGERVMVAWNSGREAARALHDALPFLAHAKHVILIAINPDLGRKEYGEEPFGPTRHHLAAHGIEAEGEALWVEDVRAMDMLLSRLTDEGIDLLVMGAHGHYGFPYLHRGGSTREILGHMTVPVLMSH